MYGMAEMGTITSMKLGLKNKSKYVGKIYDKRIIAKILSDKINFYLKIK